MGFDDNRELNLEGAHSALPVWAEFMKHAAQFRPYRDAKAFAAPAGIVSVPVCGESGASAGPFCPDVRNDVFWRAHSPTSSARNTIHESPRIRRPSPWH